MNSDKISKLKKLLNVSDSFININGLNFDETDNFDDDLEEVDKDLTDKLFFERDINRKCIKPKCMKVESVIKEEDDYIYINDNLPKIPFSLLSCGARGSGKSVLTLSLMDKMESYFDNIIIFSGTVELDHKWKLWFEKVDREFEFGKNIFKTYSETILRKILRKIKRANINKPFKDKVSILMVFDDVIMDIPKNKRNTVFNKLLFNNRHYNISLVINSQSMHCIDSNYRKNSSQIVLFKSFNILELKNYYEEFAALLGTTPKECRQNFMKIFNYATSGAHDFLYINTHNSPNIFFKNLDECICVPDIISKPVDFYLPDILRRKEKVENGKII